MREKIQYADRKHKKHTLNMIVSVAALCGLLFGFDTGIISGASIFIRQAFHVSVEGTEIIVSSVLLGAMIGAVASGRLTDRIGRRNIMLITAVFFIIGASMSATAVGVWTLALSRLIVGFAIGTACYAAPLYISEIAPASHRGSLVVLNTVMVTGGIVLAYVISIALAEDGQWRWMLGLGVVPAIILLLGIIKLPKSPRWLIEKGELEQALRVLDYLRPSQQLAEQEWSDISKSVAETKRAHWSEMFKGRMRWLLVLGCGLAIIQQVTGINTILYYAPSIFEKAGFHNIGAQLMATLGMGVTNFLATIVALKLVDRVGRRPLLLYGLLFMTLSLFAVSIAFHFEAYLPGIRWILLLSLMIFVASYAVSIGCLFWLLIAEIYPLRLRGVAMSLAASCNWLANFIVAGSFLTLLVNLGAGNTFLLYALISVASLIFCYLLTPETRGVSLESIERGLSQKNIPLRKIGV